MYLEHFGLREPPFRITPHTEFFFAGANRGATLDALIYAITHDEGIVKVSGEVGSGKTMLCRVLLERLPANVVTVYLATPSLSRDDILHALAEELRLPIPPAARSAQIVRLLQDHLIQLHAQGCQVVVLIDEAHVMPRETLEEIRLLSNLETNQHKLLQLVMFGQPELNDILARHDMRQLKERITHNFTLGPLGRDETADYIDFRLRAAGYKGAPVFSPPALSLLAAAALGLTRRINILADKSLLAAYAVGRNEVGQDEAKAAIEDCDFSVAAPPPSIRRAAYLVAAGIAGLGL
ncbi:MAG TPA: AAA family ATPase, partial [Rhodocyclaceae bacterium]|nr:AAA family ATPase [Rhodocyclaceae bacterium]